MDNREQYGNLAKIIGNINDTIENEVYNNIRLSIISEDFVELARLLSDAISSNDINKKFAVTLITKKVPLIYQDDMISVINEG